MKTKKYILISILTLLVAISSCRKDQEIPVGIVFNSGGGNSGGGGGDEPVYVDYSKLRLNELNGNDKFIEIYNTGNEDINMEGVYIMKDEAQNWIGVADVTIQAHGYLLLYSEDVITAEDYPESLIFHSKLSAKKNIRIQLFTPTGESIDDFNLTNIDLNGEAYGYPSNTAPASYSRNSDGYWYYADATPGAANVDGENILYGLEGGVIPTPGSPEYSNLILNELNGDTKFIELYNMGEEDLVLDGLYLMKDDNLDPIWTGNGTLTISAHEYLVLYSIDVQADHPELAENYFFNAGISSKKTTRFALYQPSGTEIDVYTRGTGEWGYVISNVAPMSYARTPDGGEWRLADPTPGTANPSSGDPIPQE